MALHSGFVIWLLPIPQVASPAVTQITDDPGNLSGR